MKAEGIFLAILILVFSGFVSFRLHEMGSMVAGIVVAQGVALVVGAFLCLLLMPTDKVPRS